MRRMFLTGRAASAWCRHRNQLLIGTVVLVGVPACQGQSFSSLKTVAAPAVDLSRYVRDQQTLVVLGKALFWDMQVGSDGRTACGTCHFHAGADHRARNQLSDVTGQVVANHLLSPADSPFRRFADITDNRSSVLSDSKQRTGSAGVGHRTFQGLSAGGENGADVPEPFGVRVPALHLRQVTPRNAPTVVNSVFTVRKFRDGRASDIFTGRTPFGDSDTRLNAVAVIDGHLMLERVRIANSSPASQAVGPPVNTTEMSYEGRTWGDIARKLLPARPLALQHVASDDSVLGPFATAGGPGLATTTYLALVKTAFQPRYWDSPLVVDDSGRIAASDSPVRLTLAEFNFPVFFGLAIQA